MAPKSLHPKRFDERAQPASTCCGVHNIGVVQYVLRLQGQADQMDHITIFAAERSGGREG